jgi:ABC transport system ATP-binding/permease protein
MGLIWINEVSVSFGGPRLLDGATLRIEAGERIGLLGRNGAGKSTLMTLLLGDITPDSGEIIRNSEVRIAMLPQDVPDDLPGTVYDVVAAGGREHLERLREYHDLTVQISRSGGNNLLKKLEEVQHRLETSGAWLYHQRVEKVIAMIDIEGNSEFRLLSAGMKRRVFLARALANDPDLLLLDEPTNHLDLSTILWIEDFLLKFEKTIMFVTHDREFLQRLATRIVEIDRGRLIAFPCNYATYLNRRQALLEAQEKEWDEFDKKLAREETWVRQGIKARRTRNEGRVRALVQMRRDRARRQEQAGNVRLTIREAERSGKLVVEATKISFAFGDEIIVDTFSTTIIRGDKVGIMGPNGIGKTTLLKILLGDLEPQQGRVRLGTGVQIAYFDQLRTQLDENRTLKDNIADGNDMVIVGGVSRHIIGYLQDFLFPPAQILSPVSSLSGGERNRLLLAKLFLLPSNVLVLDEPTNDLDAETLELLEERLLDYSGTILVVSHDRAFLNNLVTSTIVFEGKGRIQEYVGGYDDWLQQQQTTGRGPRQTSFGEGGSEPPPCAPSRSSGQTPRSGKTDKPPQERQKLSFKETRELKGLPQTIEALEEEKQRLITTLNSPAFYVNAGRDAVEIKKASDRLKALDEELDDAYARWDELDNLTAKFNGKAM